MANFNSPLQNIKVASPCSANWEEMYGNERKRFCGQCELNVFNLSGMTTEEAESLILNAEGRLCVRFYQRNDGTVITQDCPVGWAKIKQRVSHAATAVFSLLITLSGGLLALNVFNASNETLMGDLAVPHTRPTPDPKPTPNPTPEKDKYPIMGAIAPPRIPQPQPTPKAKPEKKEQVTKRT